MLAVLGGPGEIHEGEVAAHIAVSRRSPMIISATDYYNPRGE